MDKIEIPSTRITSIRMYGVPVIHRDETVFNPISEKVGKLVIQCVPWEGTCIS